MALTLIRDSVWSEWRMDPADGWEVRRAVPGRAVGMRLVIGRGAGPGLTVELRWRRARPLP